jgi:hypothetical protein
MYVTAMHYQSYRPPPFFKKLNNNSDGLPDETLFTRLHALKVCVILTLPMTAKKHANFVALPYTRSAKPPEQFPRDFLISIVFHKHAEQREVGVQTNGSNYTFERTITGTQILMARKFPRALMIPPCSASAGGFRRTTHTKRTKSNRNIFAHITRSSYYCNCAQYKIRCSRRRK